jgi:hypothetical protein
LRDDSGLLALQLFHPHILFSPLKSNTWPTLLCYPLEFAPDLITLGGGLGGLFLRGLQLAKECRFTANSGTASRRNHKRLARRA